MSYKKIFLFVVVSVMGIIALSITLSIVHTNETSDYRMAKLKHVGTMKVTPNVEHFVRGTPFFLLTSGKRVQFIVNYCLFQNTNRCKNWKNIMYSLYKRKNTDWEMEWLLKPEFDENQYYALCYSCSINFISYYQHTKYDNPHGVDAAVIDDYSLSPLPDGESIRVYTIDEPLYKVP